MGFPWRKVAHIATAVVGVMYPQVLIAEQAIEGLVDAKGAAKKDAAIKAAIDVLKSYEQVTGLSFKDHPNVMTALNALNDALVGLRVAIHDASEAHSPNDQD